MFARTILALMSSPYHGFRVMLTTLPIMVAGGIAMVVSIFESILVLVLWLVLGLIVQIAVHAQAARTAASVTGLKGLLEQPNYFASFRSTALVTLVASVIGFVSLVAATIAYIRLSGPGDFWWADKDRLLETASLFETSDGQAQVAARGLELGYLPLLLQGISMAFVAAVALFALPRAIGLRDGYGRGYVPSLIGARFFVAVPFFALLATVTERLLVVAGAAGLSAAGLPEVYAHAVGPFLGLAFFTGMIFAFEAHLLRTGRERDEVERAARLNIAAPESAQMRALRGAWNER